MTLDRLVARHRPALVRFARGYCASREDAEDAVQAALVIAHRRRDASEGPTGLPWIKVVVRHEALNARRPPTVPLERIGDPAAVEIDRDALIDAMDVLGRLKADEARALMCRGLGWRYHEIADRLSWTRTKTNRCVHEGRVAARALAAARDKHDTGDNA